jgi:protein-S-isoprenylcysteine O-methyltransferase Ste14
MRSNKEHRSHESKKFSADKAISESKKAQAILIALVNLNAIFFLTPLFKFELELAVQMITAILFLVGIYVGVQGGVEMIQSNKSSFSREEVIVSDEKYAMEYVGDSDNRRRKKNDK